MKTYKVILWLQNGNTAGVWTVKAGFHTTMTEGGQFLIFRGETTEGKEIELIGLRHNSITIEHL